MNYELELKKGYEKLKEYIKFAPEHEKILKRNKPKSKSEIILDMCNVVDELNKIFD